MKPSYLTKRFLVALRQDEVKIRMTRIGGSHCGWCIGHVLLIDHRDDILTIFVHELLHYLYPKKNEKWVLKEEREYMKHAPWRAKKALLQELIELA